MAGGISAMRPAHCAAAALVVWGLVWCVHLTMIQLPRSSPPLLARMGAERRPKRLHTGMVMEDGSIVPVRRANDERPSIELPTREALDRERQITLVLAARAADDVGFPRLGSLTASLRKFCAPDAVAEMLLLAPTSDRHVFETHAAFASLPFAWRVIDDSGLLSRPTKHFKRYTPRREWAENGGRGVNYRVQMLLKIAVATLVQTEYYLTLDCDVLAVQPITFDALVPGGRGLVQGEPFPYEQRHEPGWWHAAEVALRARGCLTPAEGGGDSAPLGGASIGVTPAVLSRALALRTMARLEEVHGGRWWGAAWDEILFRLLSQSPDELNWTEYTLYFTAGCEWAGALERLHAPPKPGAKTLYSELGFDWGDWELWEPSQAFGPDGPALFTVLQSISGVEPQWVDEQVAPYLGGTVQGDAVGAGLRPRANATGTVAAADAARVGPAAPTGTVDAATGTRARDASPQQQAPTAVPPAAAVEHGHDAASTARPS